jgi:hypothetical protein
MTMKVLNANVWKAATPKGVLVNGAWQQPKRVSVLAGGAWKVVWEEPVAAEPPYLYDITIEYLPNYEVKFTAKIGAPEDPEDAFMFRCVQMPRDGYTGRVFNKTWVANGYSKLDCTLEDMSNVPGRDRRTINFFITPRP